MKTAYALLLDRCGMSHKDAAKFHDVKLEVVNGWATGKKEAPEDAIYGLRDVYHMIQSMAYDAVDMIDKQKPAGIELELAKDEAEAIELGLPCIGAHEAALGIIVAACDCTVTIAKPSANDA